MKISKAHNLAYGISAVIILVILSIIFLTSPQHDGFQPRWYKCLDFWEKGTAYGGEPFCNQGPVVYITGLLLKLIFGAENLQLFSKILTIVLSIIMFFVALEIIKKETSETPYFILGILFIPFLFYPLQGYLDMALASFFLIAGFYVLFYRKSKYKEIVSGLFFSLSLLSKISSAYLIVTFIIVYSVKLGETESWLKLKFKNKQKALMLVLATLSLVLLLFIIKPLSFKYLILAPIILSQTGLTYFAAFKFLLEQLTTNFFHIFPIILLLLINSYALKKYRHPFFWIVVPSFLSLLEVLRVLEHFLDFRSYYYLLPSMIFLIIGLVLFFLKEKSGKPKITIIVASLLIIFFVFLLLMGVLALSSGEKTIPLKVLSKFSLITLLGNDVEGTGLQKLMGKPLLFIPAQDGEVLLAVSITKEDYHQNNFLHNFDKNMVKTSEKLPFEMDPNAGLDFTWINNDGLANLLGGREQILSRWTTTPGTLEKSAKEKIKKLVQIKRKLLDLEYNLIIITYPPAWEIVQFVNDNLPYFKKHYSFSTLTTVDNTVSSRTFLMFKNKEDAEKMDTIIQGNLAMHSNKIQQKFNELPYLIFLNDFQRWFSLLVVSGLFLIRAMKRFNYK